MCRAKSTITVLADTARATAPRESERRSLLAAGATMGKTHEVGISFSNGRSRRSLVMISSASRLSIAAPSSLRVAAGYREPAVILVRLLGVGRGAQVVVSSIPERERHRERLAVQSQDRVAVGAADDHDPDHRQTERPQRLSLAMQQGTSHSLSCPACAAPPRSICPALIAPPPGASRRTRVATTVRADDLTLISASFAARAASRSPALARASVSRAWSGGLVAVALLLRSTARPLSCSATCLHWLPPFAGTQIACGSAARPSSGRTR